MTERERWIVYPLLFLALGAALRDKLLDNTMVSRKIVCEELVVVDAGRSPRGPVLVAQIRALPAGPAGQQPVGQILVNGRIDANGFFRNGVPIEPVGRTMVPNIPLPELFRAWQRSMEGNPPPGTQPPSPGQPSAPETRAEPAATEAPASPAPPSFPELGDSESQ